MVQDHLPLATALLLTIGSIPLTAAPHVKSVNPKEVAQRPDLLQLSLFVGGEAKLLTFTGITTVVRMCFFSWLHVIPSLNASRAIHKSSHVGDVEALKKKATELRSSQRRINPCHGLRLSSIAKTTYRGLKLRDNTYQKNTRKNLEGAST